MVKKFFVIDESKALHENRSFWLALGVPVVIAVIFALPIILAGKLEFNFSDKGYDYFIQLFSFPLWIASMSLVTGVMVGRFHGSKQRAKAMKQAQAQNEFSNYFNHQDYFCKHLDEIAEKHGVKIDKLKIYKIIFSGSSTSEVKVNIASNIFDVFKGALEQLQAEVALCNDKQRKFDLILKNLEPFSKSIGIEYEAPKFNYQSLETILVVYKEFYIEVISYSGNGVEKKQQIKEYIKFPFDKLLSTIRTEMFSFEK